MSKTTSLSLSLSLGSNHDLIVPGDVLATLQGLPELRNQVGGDVALVTQADHNIGVTACFTNLPIKIASGGQVPSEKQ
jgi:hypothetical protein